jgi:hypothetical protein
LGFVQVFGRANRTGLKIGIEGQEEKGWMYEEVSNRLRLRHCSGVVTGCSGLWCWFRGTAEVGLARILPVAARRLGIRFNITVENARDSV